MNKSFVEWLDYYENATKEDVIQDMMLDINSIKEKNNEIERLNNIIFNQNKRNSHQRIANDNLQNKNKELNNIINELERILQQDLENEKDIYWTNITKEDYIEFMLNKLQELKGSDKE